jgi:hypothetical protein
VISARCHFNANRRLNRAVLMLVIIHFEVHGAPEGCCFCMCRSRTCQNSSGEAENPSPELSGTGAEQVMSFSGGDAARSPSSSKEDTIEDGFG